MLNENWRLMRFSSRHFQFKKTAHKSNFIFFNNNSLVYAQLESLVINLVFLAHQNKSIEK